jgi:hypothetical protein
MRSKNPYSLLVLAALAAALIVVPALAQKPIQRTFPTAEEAWKALFAAASSGDKPALQAVFGPGCEEMLSSGDPVADKSAIELFLEKAKEKASLVPEGKDKVIVVIGAEEWPFAVPIVKKGGAWCFDTAAGKEEMDNRRVGKNELYTINACLAYVDAQEEFSKAHKVPHYAQKFFSDEGKRDGLYWEAKEGQPESPLGPLAAEASKEGYRRSGTGQPTPFHGYFYKILKAQGKNAPGGAKSYIKGDMMTEGFALVAYPANYGASGIMTFIVNQQGIVFEKDLGPKTEEIAGTMKDYDPDQTWWPAWDY